MRKIILGLAVSLDGFIEGPQGEYDWCFTDKDYGMADFLQTIDAIFMGRKSFEVSGNPFPQKKCYVFSNNILDVPPDVEIMVGDAVSWASKLKEQPGRHIWLFGGASLNASLMNAGLVDEVWLAVHPIVLGKGKPLFDGINERTRLMLTDTQEYSSGLVSLRYRVIANKANKEKLMQASRY